MDVDMQRLLVTKNILVKAVSYINTGIPPSKICLVFLITKLCNTWLSPF